MGQKRDKKEKTPKKVIMVRVVCIVMAASIVLPILVYNLLY